jgi:hypothetical protein
MGVFQQPVSIPSDFLLAASCITVTFFAKIRKAFFVPHAFTSITNTPGSTGAGNKKFVLLRDNYYIENHATCPLKKFFYHRQK